MSNLTDTDVSPTLTAHSDNIRNLQLLFALLSLAPVYTLAVVHLLQLRRLPLTAYSLLAHSVCISIAIFITCDVIDTAFLTETSGFIRDGVLTLNMIVFCLTELEFLSVFAPYVSTLSALMRNDKQRACWGGPIALRFCQTAAILTCLTPWIITHFSSAVDSTNAWSFVNMIVTFVGVVDFGIQCFIVWFVFTRIRGVTTRLAWAFAALMFLGAVLLVVGYSYPFLIFYNSSLFVTSTYYIAIVDFCLVTYQFVGIQLMLLIKRLIAHPEHKPKPLLTAASDQFSSSATRSSWIDENRGSNGVLETHSLPVVRSARGQGNVLAGASPAPLPKAHRGASRASLVRPALIRSSTLVANSDSRSTTAGAANLTDSTIIDLAGRLANNPVIAPRV
nr:hypothetical protein HK105_005706 [Polyrhizophydium stewartii]